VYYTIYVTEVATNQIIGKTKAPKLSVIVAGQSINQLQMKPIC